VDYFAFAFIDTSLDFSHDETETADDLNDKVNHKIFTELQKDGYSSLLINTLAEYEKDSAKNKLNLPFSNVVKIDIIPYLRLPDTNNGKEETEVSKVDELV
jgi:hypothetical protein